MSQQNSSGSGNSNAKIQSFLEALKANRGNSPKNPGSESPFNPFAEIQAKKESEQRRIELFHQARQQEWNPVFSSKNREVSNRIESIRRQIQDLARQVKRLDLNIVRAVKTQINNPGQYDESFLTHLEKTIRMHQMSVNSTNTWLEAYNSRSTKKSVYWQMAKSKGNSYTQSDERTVATSVG